MTVGQRFDALLANLTLTDAQIENGRNAHQSVRRCLNSHYYGYSSDSANSMLVGSWGKSTRMRPPRDVDVLFALPTAVRDRYTTGNRQSQILQEVKRVLLRTFSNTDIAGDGPAVLIPFSAYSVELVPAFFQYGTIYDICHTNNGGSFKAFSPESECDSIKQSDDASKGNTRHLTRMMKRWQDYCNVPMKSFWLELLAVQFLSSWQYRGNSTTYYDWMTRDFFVWLANKGASQWNYLSVPGTSELISIGNSWSSKAESARDRAKKATDHEAANEPYSAGAEWQKIFGDFIPTG